MLAQYYYDYIHYEDIISVADASSVHGSGIAAGAARSRRNRGANNNGEIEASIICYALSHHEKTMVIEVHYANNGC